MKPESDYYEALSIGPYPEGPNDFGLSVRVWYDRAANPDHVDGFEVTLLSRDSEEFTALSLDRGETVQLVDALVRALSGDHPYEVAE